MILKVVITDLQNRKMYRATLNQSIIQGEDLLVQLTDPGYKGYGFRINQVRGWVSDLDGSNIYLIDNTGKRFRLRMLKEAVEG